MEKVSGTFWISCPYLDKNEKEQKARVVLDINYRSRYYDILPNNGGGSFVFKNTSHDWKMWKAVIKCIDEAIDFANKELDITT